MWHVSCEKFQQTLFPQLSLHCRHTRAARALRLRRAELEQPLDGICGLCGNTHLDVSSVYLYKGMEICHSCILYAMGAEQRRELDRFFVHHR